MFDTIFEMGNWEISSLITNKFCFMNSVLLVNDWSVVILTNKIKLLKLSVS